MDYRIKTPCSFLLCGPTKCGKTTFVLKFIDFADLILSDPRCTQNIIYFYKLKNDKFDRYKNKIRFIQGCPKSKDIEEMTLPYKDRGGSMVIIDDFGQDLGKDIVDVFTVLSHHANITVFLLLQNLFTKAGGYCRDVSLNASHILVFQNPRDQQQIQHLARQVAPGNSKYIVSVWDYLLTNYPYSYLWFDNEICTNSLCRVKTNVLPHEWPMMLFKPKSVQYE
jgi:hypothetical protein